jgi:hypothetical protein
MSFTCQVRKHRPKRSTHKGHKWESLQALFYDQDDRKKEVLPHLLTSYRPGKPTI